jgi:hypothetical protein
VIQILRTGFWLKLNNPNLSIHSREGCTLVHPSFFTFSGLYLELLQKICIFAKIILIINSKLKTYDEE